MPKEVIKKEPKNGLSLQGFDVKAYKQTEAYTQAVDALYNQAVQEFAVVAGGVSVNPNKPFSFSDYPQAKVKAQQIINGLAVKMKAVIVKGNQDQWLYACKKNDAFLNHIMNTSKLPKNLLATYQDKNLDALDAFQKRKVGGIDLSKRIWNYAGQMKDQMELGIDIAVGEGKSAASLSRDLRQYLQDPDKLFHKVKDKHGLLHISKNAAAFHPGQGKYRSSYKNAMRLTRSEINMAYRVSDQIRWQNLDFIVGFEVKLSNNHTTLVNGVPEPFTDICDDLAGKYPKSFLFKGWHPQCRCHVVPIMKADEEIGAQQFENLRAAWKGDNRKQFQSKNQVNDVPDNFKQWMADNLDKSQGWKSAPYFVKDNFQGGTLAGGLKVATIAPKVAIKPIKTPEQKASIQKLWNNRVLRNKYKIELQAIKNTWHEVPSIMEQATNVGMEISAGVDPKIVDTMVQKLRHKIEVKKAWDALKPIKKAKALLNKTTKMTNNLVAKAEAEGYTGADLDKVKQLLNKPDVTNAELNSAYGKLNKSFKASKAAIADPFSKEALLKTYTQDEVDGLFKAYDSFYAAKVNGQDIGTQVKKLDFEITWLEKNGKYKTSGVLKQMLERDVKKLKLNFELEIYKKDASSLVTAHKATNDPKVSSAIAELQKAIKNPNADAAVLKAAIDKANKAVDDYNTNNIRTISPDDFKFFEDEKSAYSISKFYTAEEKAKVKELREKLNNTIKNTKGDIRSSSVQYAQKELTEYMYDIQFKYVAQQKALKHIGMKLNSKNEFDFDHITDAEAKAAFERYIIAKQSGSGFYSNNVGGEYWTPICRSYTKRVKAAGVKITAEATLPTRYFSGSSFINSYISKKDFSHVTSNSVLQESLHDYVSALSYSVSKLPRHNGITYRGISYAKDIIDDLVSCKMSGKAFTHKLGMSTSITPNVADNFGTGITFKIYGRSGIYAREFSAYSSELEVLYRPGSKFEVMEVYQETSANGIAHQGKWAVVLKEVLD